MKIYLAPMEGVVDWVIRDIYSRIGGYDEMVSEFVRVTTQLNPPKVFHRYVPELKTDGKTLAGTPVYVQLLGGDPICVAENAALACELGSLGIDLNFGCPAKTVNRHDGGAALLQRPRRLYDMITAVKNAVPEHIPVCAKIRLGYNDKTLVNEIAKAVSESQAHRLIVHARTKKEGYKPPAHWEFIAKIKEDCPNLPVIANGDIWTVEDYKRCLKITGCKDIALGRPAMAMPDLALQIKGQAKQFSHDYIEKELLPSFITSSANFKDNKYAVRRTKQWVKLLGRTYPYYTELFHKVKLCQNMEDLKKIISF